MRKGPRHCQARDLINRALTTKLHSQSLSTDLNSLNLTTMNMNIILYLHRRCRQKIGNIRCKKQLIFSQCLGHTRLTFVTVKNMQYLSIEVNMIKKLRFLQYICFHWPRDWGPQRWITMEHRSFQRVGIQYYNSLIIEYLKTIINIQLHVLHLNIHANTFDSAIVNIYNIL